MQWYIICNEHNKNTVHVSLLKKSQRNRSSKNPQSLGRGQLRERNGQEAIKGWAWPWGNLRRGLHPMTGPWRTLHSSRTKFKSWNTRTSYLVLKLMKWPQGTCKSTIWVSFLIHGEFINQRYQKDCENYFFLLVREDVYFHHKESENKLIYQTLWSLFF